MEKLEDRSRLPGKSGGEKRLNVSEYLRNESDDETAQRTVDHNIIPRSGGNLLDKTVTGSIYQIAAGLTRKRGRRVNAERGEY